MPNIHFEYLESRFRACANSSARVEQLFSGCVWAEGPVYFPAHQSLIWSDIPNDRMLRWDALTQQTAVFRQQSNFSNGNTVDRQGRLITCEQGSRRVTRTEHDGSITVLVERYQGRRFNSPNDVVVHSDGSIWFTDPAYGIDSNFEGHKAESEIGGDHVYRLDPATAECRIVADDFRRPNGLAFSRDETKLYIVDSGGARFPDNPRHIREFQVTAAGKLTGGHVLARCGCGSFDGLRIDEDGRLWVSAEDGVHCFEPDGTLIGKVLVPEEVSNVVFGGPRNNRLFITASSSLYAVLLSVRGASPFGRG